MTWSTVKIVSFLNYNLGERGPTLPPSLKRKFTLPDILDSAQTKESRSVASHNPELYTAVNKSAGSNVYANLPSLNWGDGNSRLRPPRRGTALSAGHPALSRVAQAPPGTDALASAWGCSCALVQTVPVQLNWGVDCNGSCTSSSSPFHGTVSLWAHVPLAPRFTPSPSQLCFQVRADNNRPRRSVSQSTSKPEKYYFSTESDEPTSSSPLNADSVPLLGGAAAAVGLGFDKPILRVIYKYFSKNGWSLSMPKMNTGIEVGGAGAGSDKKFRCESMAKLNEFSRELRTFREVDLAGRAFGDEGFVYLAEGLAFNQSAESVDFLSNGITAMGVKALSQVLPTNTFLKTLNFFVNSIGDEGATELAGLLEKNHGISKLQLNSINVGDEGAKAIAAMLKKNERITHLELNNNVIDYAGFAELADALTIDKTFRSIHIK